MIVIVKDLLTDTEQTFTGSEEQVEDQLRMAFPGLSLSVELGDLDMLIWCLGNCHDKVVDVPEGHVSEPDTYLPIRFDMIPHTCGEMCIPLVNKAESFADEVDNWLLEKAIGDIKPGIDTEKKVSYRLDNIKSHVYDYSHLVPEHLRQKYQIQVHERPKGADGVKGANHLETYLVKHPFDFGTCDIGKLSGMVHPKYKNGDKDLKISLAEIDDSHRGQKLGAAMYEAMMAHAKHYHGATHVVGGTHSSMSHNVHLALARRHGMEYSAQYLGQDAGKWDMNDHKADPKSPTYLQPDQFHPEPLEFDEAYSPYFYAIKSETEVELIKGEKPIFKAAGFRHKETGEVASTGVFHNIYELPEHWKVDEDHLSHIEAGFIDYDGKFYTRQEAADKINSPKPNLQSEDIKGLGRKPGEEQIGGGAGLVKMAIADIPPGIEKKGQKKYGLTRYSKFHDYQHVLSPVMRRHYFLTVREKAQSGYGPEYSVKLHSRRIRDYRGWPLEVGQSDVNIRPSDSSDPQSPKAVYIHDVSLHPRYRNKGLGMAMYEAAFAHAKHIHKASVVKGGTHSTLAHDVHQRLSRKHGLEYQADFNEDWGDMTPSPASGAYDAAYGKYQYALKSEQPLNKMALADIPKGKAIESNDLGSQWDYSHILPDNHQKKYKIKIHEQAGSDAYASDHAYERDPYANDVYAYLHDENDKPIGNVSGTIHPDEGLRIWESHVHPDHRGQGLGTNLYEALMTHAFHHHGIKAVRGDVHSSMANRSHSKLAQKHGFGGYNPYRNNAIHGAYDDAFGKYKYTLKSDDDSWLALADNLNTAVDDEDSEVVEDMSGFAPRVHSAFEAARFLIHGRESLSLDQIRRALYKEDGDFERAALRAYNIEPNDANLNALRAVMKLGFLNKAERPEPMRVDCPIQFSADSCSEVQRGISSNMVQHVNLNGKYSQGSMVVRDPKTEHVYLLKPDSEGISPAAGVNEEPEVSQPRREACYWQIANLLGLGGVIPRADLITIDGDEWAAIRLLPYNFKNLEKRWKADRNTVMNIMERYRSIGLLHKWAVLDYVLGNPDRHGQNLMIGHGSKMAPIDREIALIDHGSAFAGYNFAPSADANSFIPFYLRIWAPSTGFNKMTPEEKMRYMPTVSHEVNETLKRWIADFSEGRIKKILEQYKIDPGPVLFRLSKLRALPDSPDIAIDKLWAGAA